MKWECENCGTIKSYIEGRDSYICVKCNEWKESQCTDPECYFCVGRKEKPFNVEEHELILKMLKMMESPESFAYLLVTIDSAIREELGEFEKEDIHEEIFNLTQYKFNNILVRLVGNGYYIQEDIYNDMIEKINNYN